MQNTSSSSGPLTFLHTVQLLCLAAPPFSIFTYCKPHLGLFGCFGVFCLFLSVLGVLGVFGSFWQFLAFLGGQLESFCRTTFQ
jgi:hypothetical protein